MIYQLYINLTKRWRRKGYIRKAIKKAEHKIWEMQFLKHQIHEVRGGMREQHDWLRERVDGAVRRKAELLYDIYYAESGDLVKVMDLPLPPREIEQLPDKPTKPHRFYKVAKKNVDKEKVAELERVIKLREPDLENQRKSLEGIAAKVREIDGGIAGTYELKTSLWNMLKQL